MENTHLIISFICYITVAVTVRSDAVQPPETVLKWNVTVEDTHVYTVSFTKDKIAEFYECLCLESTSQCQVSTNTSGLVTTVNTLILDPLSSSNMSRYVCEILDQGSSIMCTKLDLADDLCLYTTRCIAYSFYERGSDNVCQFDSVEIVWRKGQKINNTQYLGNTGLLVKACRPCFFPNNKTPTLMPSTKTVVSETQIDITVDPLDTTSNFDTTVGYYTTSSFESMKSLITLPMVSVVESSSSASLSLWTVGLSSTGAQSNTLTHDWLVSASQITPSMTTAFLTSAVATSELVTVPTISVAESQSAAFSFASLSSFDSHSQSLTQKTSLLPLSGVTTSFQTLINADDFETASHPMSSFSLPSSVPDTLHIALLPMTQELLLSTSLGLTLSFNETSVDHSTPSNDFTASSTTLPTMSTAKVAVYSSIPSLYSEVSSQSLSFSKSSGKTLSYVGEYSLTSAPATTYLIMPPTELPTSSTSSLSNGLSHLPTQETYIPNTSSVSQSFEASMNGHNRITTVIPLPIDSMKDSAKSSSLLPGSSSVDLLSQPPTTLSSLSAFSSALSLSTLTSTTSFESSASSFISFPKSPVSDSISSISPTKTLFIDTLSQWLTKESPSFSGETTPFKTILDTDLSETAIMVFPSSGFLPSKLTSALTEATVTATELTATTSTTSTTKYSTSSVTPITSATHLISLLVTAKTSAALTTTIPTATKGNAESLVGTSVTGATGDVSSSSSVAVTNPITPPPTSVYLSTASYISAGTDISWGNVIIITSVAATLVIITTIICIIGAAKRKFKRYHITIPSKKRKKPNNNRDNGNYSSNIMEDGTTPKTTKTDKANNNKHNGSSIEEDSTVLDIDEPSDRRQKTALPGEDRDSLETFAVMHPTTVDHIPYENFFPKVENKVGDKITSKDDIVSGEGSMSKDENLDSDTSMSGHDITNDDDINDQAECDTASDRLQNSNGGTGTDIEENLDKGDLAENDVSSDFSADDDTELHSNNGFDFNKSESTPNADLCVDCKSKITKKVAFDDSSGEESSVI